MENKSIKDHHWKSIPPSGTLKRKFSYAGLEDGKADKFFKNIFKESQNTTPFASYIRDML